MARKVFGVAALTALAGMIACSDPTGDLRNGAQRVYTNFSLSLVDLGKTTLVNARILDDQGNPLPGAITATSSNEAAVTVAEVDTFRPQLQDKLTRQFLVTTSALDSVLLTFSGGGVTGTSVVKVKPLSLPAVFSTTTPNVLDLVTVTAPLFKFTPATTVTFGGLPQTIAGFAADSSSVTFQVVNQGLGTILVVGAAPSYLLDSPITLSSVNILTAATAAVGTDAIATAPEIVLPAAGQSATVTDDTPFNNSADCNNSAGGYHCRIYKLNLTGADVDVSATWDNNSDVGVYFSDAAGVDTGEHGCDGLGAGASGHPEECTITGLTGTYYMYVVTFAAFYAAPNNVDAGSISLTLTSH